VREAILLTQYGGLEIAEAMDRIVVAPKLDIAAAHKLAEVAGGRGQNIPFDIFNRHALDLLADAANRAALEGQGPRANRLTESWHEALTSVTETETYNLDKKQHALGMIIRLTVSPCRMAIASPMRYLTATLPKSPFRTAFHVTRKILHHYPDLLSERQAAYRPCL
jgi:hypothetical protein